MSEAFDRALGDVARHHHVDNPTFISMIPITVMDPLFLTLLDDDRITGLADILLGEDSLYLDISNGVVWNRPSPWHPDHNALERTDVKIVLYLDTLDVDSGCLTVVPGSHQPDYHRALRRAFEDGLLQADRPEVPGAVAVPNQPGDVLVFHRALWHSTWGPPRPRRQISFNFHAAPQGTEHYTTRWEDAYLAGVATRFRTWQAGFQLYESGFVDSAGPRRLRKIQPLLDLGFADPNRPSVTRDKIFSSAGLPWAG